jgi:hypothetical protein
MLDIDDRTNPTAPGPSPRFVMEEDPQHLAVSGTGSNENATYFPGKPGRSSTKPRVIVLIANRLPAA